MADLQERLREAGRALDERAPSFDPAVLRRRPVDPELGAAPAPTPIADTAEGRAADHRRRNRTVAVLAGIAAAIVVVVVSVAVLTRDRTTIDTGPAVGIQAPDDGEAPTTPAPTPTSSPLPTSEVPDVLEITCNGDGTVLSTDRVQARADGVHVVVHNPHPMAGVTIDFGDPTSDFRSTPVQIGDNPSVQALRPGTTGIACTVGGVEQAPAPVEVLDPLGAYVEPSLSCAAPTPRGTLDFGPPIASRSTVALAVRNWRGVSADTPLRTVRYPEAARREVVAATDDGDLAFTAWSDHEGRWVVEPSRWCTGKVPARLADVDPVRAWYDGSQPGLDRLTSTLTEIADDPDPASASRLDLVCSDVLWAAGREQGVRLPDDIAALVADVELDLAALVDGACRMDPALGSGGMPVPRPQDLDEARTSLLALRDAVDDRP